ncbi:MAG: NAD-dependent epimerase/dehydratase family protein [Actinomycetota bacterium]
MSDQTVFGKRHVVLGAGPVGAAVADVITGHGGEAVVLSRSGRTVPGAQSAAVDITDADALARHLAGAAVVYQCAQPAYHRWAEEFPAMQRAVVDACSRVGARLVVVENLYGYGHVDGPISRTLPLNATTKKGRVRAAMWTSLEQAYSAAVVEVVAVRGSDFIGPRVTASMFGERFIAPLVAGKAAEVLGPLDVRHSVTYVPDLATAMVEIGARDDALGQAWLAPCAPAATVAELVALLASAADVEPRTRRVRAWQLRAAGLFMPAARETVEMLYEFADDFVVDSQETTDRFGLRATPLAEVAARTVDWYRQRADQSVATAAKAVS